MACHLTVSVKAAMCGRRLPQTNGGSFVRTVGQLSRFARSSPPRSG